MLSVCAAALLTASCSDDDHNNAVLPTSSQYCYTLSSTSDIMSITLSELKGNITGMQGVPAWLKVEQSELDEAQHPIINVTTQESEVETSNTAVVTLTDALGNSAELTLSQAFNFINSNNSDEEFNSDWENQESVYIYSSRGSEEVYTPWSPEFSSTTMPLDICQNIRKKDGWEMAFNCLNNPKGRDLNYFGLYNKYTGVLRVFYYVTNSTTTGSEYTFEVNFGNVINGNKQSYYNTLSYSVPINTTVNPTVNLLGTNENRAFKTLVSPYNAMSSSALPKGWVAFDLDFSAYSANKFTEEEIIQIACRTQLNQSITLNGEMKAELNGNFSSPTPAASASSGFGSTLGSIGGFLGDVQNSALANIDEALTGSAFNKYFYYGGAICSGAGVLFDWFTDAMDMGEKLPRDSMTGKIELNMNGTINLSGYMSSMSSNAVTPISIRRKSLMTDTHFGQGIWNLKQNPVLYIVSDLYMGKPRTMTFMQRETNKFMSGNAKDNHLRFVQFMDPNSLIPEINPELFPDAKDVKLVWYYGIFPHVQKNHTHKYRSMMKLTPNPNSIDIRSNCKNGERFTTSSNNQRQYKELDVGVVKSEHLDKGNECSIEEVKEDGKVYRYYGNVQKENGMDKRYWFIRDPEVLFPTDESGNYIFNMNLPDYVVVAHLTFTSQGHKFSYIRHFLPEIKYIKRSELKKKSNELNTYMQKSLNGQAISNLSNGSRAGVIHPEGYKQVSFAKRLLDAVAN